MLFFKKVVRLPVIAMVGTDGNNTDLIRQECIKRGIKFVVINPRSVRATISKGKVVYVSDDANLKEIDVFLFRGISSSKTEGELQVSVYPEMLLFAQYLYYELKKVIVDEKLAKENPILSKFVTGYKLTHAGLPYADTYLYFTKEQVTRDLDKLKYPLILKPAAGSKGRGVYLIKDATDLKEFMKKDNAGDSFYPNILQGRIPNDGDYRLLVVGGKIITAVKKQRSKGSVTANMSQENEAIKINPDPELRRLAIKAAEILDIEIAGVDIIEDKKTKKRYILEVNRAPQIFHTTKFSGVNIAEQIVNYMVAKFNKFK